MPQGFNVTKQLPSISTAKNSTDTEKSFTTLQGRGLAAILNKKSAMPTKVDGSDLLPLMCRIMDAAFRLGYMSFKENAKYVLSEIHKKFGDDITNTLNISHLQGGYIGMEKGTTSKMEVVNIKSIEELYLDDELCQSSDLIELIKNDISSEFDHEMMLDGFTLAGYHIEQGARNYSEFSQAMITDLGESIRPYLLVFYESIRHYPGFDSSGMDDPKAISNLNKVRSQND